MIVNILKSDKIRKIILPEKVYGVYSIMDDNAKMLANIEGENNNWVLKANSYVEFQENGTAAQDVQLKPYVFYTIKILVTGEIYSFIVTPTLDETNKRYIAKKQSITIGTSGCDISYSNNAFKNQKIVLTKNGKHWTIENNGSEAYINDRAFKKRNMFHGDILFVGGLLVIVINDMFIINNPNGQVNVSSEAFENYQYVQVAVTYQKGIAEDKPFYEKSDYFNKAPRFKSVRDDYSLSIQSPPAMAQEQAKMPLLLTMGPMIASQTITVFSLVQQINSYVSGQITFIKLVPILLTFTVTLMSLFLWPTLTRLYTKRLKRREEALRRKKYTLYLEGKEKEVNERLSFEKQVLVENALPLTECQSIIYNRKRNLWERSVSDEDFLNFRIGTGTVSSKITIDGQPEFDIDDENDLKKRYQELVNRSKIIEEAPMDVSLLEHQIMAVVGNNVLTKYFMDSVFLQLTTFHSFRDLKIFVITNEKNEFLWEYLKVLPHCWDNQKTQRYFSTNAGDMNSIAARLETIFKTRLASAEDDSLNKMVDDGDTTKTTYQQYDTYFLIFIDDLEMARNVSIIKEILKYKQNFGFSILIRNDKLSNLPSECKTFIDVEPNISGLFQSDIREDNQKQFKAELNKDIDMYGCAIRLANIPILGGKVKYELPSSISFLTMYNVGKVEQLNSLERWKKNNPALSLSVPVGIDQDGELFKMDAHEKGFGPHGLVAGTTGSGKSEWLITYILSLAVNFHPDEVQFVLIDYKGGGLALSFENKEAGIKLPHLAGTITNLDKSAINRALTSIEAELKSRQATFNEAREKLHESSMDIKKYQQLYRKGLVDKPVSHLFLISDEFAELKSQQPEFLEQLVSTARIGRSLGVHLILATQKPNGVVNEQIWSNSRFHVCLRVQDKGDSNAMIKTPDAAMLKTTGAFYLQVGFNEYYALGQSAWAGAKYHPSDIVKKDIDDTIQYIDNLGNTINSYTEAVETDLSKEDHGEELFNIVSYISNISKETQILSKPLWLPNIEEEIFLDDVKKKYNWKFEKCDLHTPIGEYDDPIRQKQDLAILDLSENTVIYGESGSGKENLISTILWNLITEHSPDEINMYVIDFGAETLRMFAKYPHVGELCLQDSPTRVAGVLQMVIDELARRKELFADYNGNYTTYVKESGEQLPRWLVVINSFDIFSENMGRMADSLDSIFRDCNKCGISFMLSVTSVNYVKGKRAQLFDNKIALSLADDFQYRDLLGARKGLVPHKNFGRGLFPLAEDYYCEFQTAYLTKAEEINKLVRKNATNFANFYKTRAKSLPTIPDTVSSKDLAQYVTTVEEVPIGYNFYDKGLQMFNFIREKIFLVSTDDIKASIQSLYGMVNILSRVPNTVVRIVDFSGIYEITNPNVRFFNDKFDAVILALKDDLAKRTDNDTQAINIIIGAGLLKTKLSEYGRGLVPEYMKNLGTAKKTVTILVDTYQRMKTLKVEPWFASINNSYGMWIGKGIENQNLFNVKDTPMEERKLNYTGFAYIVDESNPVLIKTVLDEE